MDATVQAKRLCQVDVLRLVLIMGALVAILLVFQYRELPKNTPSQSPTAKSFITMINKNSSTSRSPRSFQSSIVNPVANQTFVTDLKEETHIITSKEPDLKNVSVDKNMTGSDDQIANEDISQQLAANLTNNAEGTTKKSKRDANLTAVEYVNCNTVNTSSTTNVKKTSEIQIKRESSTVSQNVSASLYNSSTEFTIADLRQKKPWLLISGMNSVLLTEHASSKEKRPKPLSARDSELLTAKLEIEDAPNLRKTSGLRASVYKNISAFQRSYDLMERTFKVYVYKEGDRPIFNEPYLLGIYSSEGWFMKLIKENQKFTVSDPGKAHMFYIPYSSNTFRIAVRSNHELDQEGYLESYVKSLAERYPFWNRTEGADHFVVACHDWGYRFTRRLKNSIRSLCNSDLKKGFIIGKDTSLPVTNIREAEKPRKDIGGPSPKGRSILAFFSGKVHGYLRPIMVDYWHNREPDMVISGHDPVTKIGVKGYREYINYMKTSKYCICAKGTSGHTPRVVESIYYECVPVIIADNYVPPFFEVLNWEAFAVFVQERDILNLRNILLSIPEEKYIKLQRNLKAVQQHFLWHENPEKYDLFHMILHSVWYNRLYQI